MSVTPDVITQDGASQSVVTVNAVGPTGAPLVNIPLRAEILVNGVPTDFGSLSARNLVTDANGRATVVFTAPSSPSGPAVDAFTLVNIGITPVGNGFGNSPTRFTTVRLVPPGIIAPPDGLVPNFTFSPENPTENQPVVFDATSSQAPGNNPIVEFRWNFGDGTTGTGPVTTHAYRTGGTFLAVLTVVDGFGRTRSVTRSIVVSPGTPPTADFVVSPRDPVPNQQVSFNASTSVAAPGRRIVSYQWDFGDGTTATGQRVSHSYALIGTYQVLLTVTDDAGRTDTDVDTVAVALPDADDQ